MSDKINISFIIEILGRPKEHLEDTLKKLIEKLGEEKGVEIIESKFHEAKKYDVTSKMTEEQKKEFEEKLKANKNMSIENELYTAFSEIEAELDGMNALMTLAFNYMPSNIEINSPENFFLKNSDVSAILTNVILRLHRYDELTKKLSVDKTILENELKKLIDKK